MANGGIGCRVIFSGRSMNSAVGVRRAVAAVPERTPSCAGARAHTRGHGERVSRARGSPPQPNQSASCRVAVAPPGWKRRAGLRPPVRSSAWAACPQATGQAPVLARQGLGLAAPPGLRSALPRFRPADSDRDR